jgi:hypothetical protein
MADNDNSILGQQAFSVVRPNAVNTNAVNLSKALNLKSI